MRIVCAFYILTAFATAADLRLSELIIRGRTDEALRLIRTGFAVDARDTRGYTPLIWAAATGNVPIVQELIGRGTRLNLRGRDGLTAFAVSMTNGHGKIPPLLVRAGADCQPPNADWRKELSSRNARAAEFLNEVILSACS